MTNEEAFQQAFDAWVAAGNLEPDLGILADKAGMTPAEYLSSVGYLDSKYLEYDSDGASKPSDSDSASLVTGAGGGSTTTSSYDPRTQWPDTSYPDVEANRVQNTNAGRSAPPADPGAPAAAPAPAAPAASGTTSSGYDTYGSSSDYTSSGSSKSKKSSSSSGSSGGGGSADPIPEVPPFPGGGFGAPNVYPTLPMTDIRRKTLENLSGPFGSSVGQFRTPPGGWREDMAPMFTSGAFGGLGQQDTTATQPVAPTSFTASSTPAMPASPAPMPAMPSMPSMFQQQAAPQPMAQPQNLMMSASMPAPAVDPATGLPAMPAFNRPGVMTPNAMKSMPGYFASGTMPKLPGSRSAKTPAPPLPPSIAKRFGL